MASGPKKLSAGTMNLKFMLRGSDGPNAPALEQKKVVDEGEWDVGPEIRQALGIQSTLHSESSGEDNLVTHESSYLPFMTNQVARGRFTFKNGVIQTRSEFQDAPPPDVNTLTLEETEDVVTKPPQPSSSKPSKTISRQPPPKAAKPVPSAQLSAESVFQKPARVAPAPSRPIKKRPASKSEPESKPQSSATASASSPVKKKKKKSHAMEVDS